MELCTETITVFNARLDDEDGYDEYNPTVIRGVSWHCEIASSVDSSGLKAANKFTVRIPLDADFSNKAYANPISYAGGDPDNLFTLKNGDIVVRGEVVESMRPSELQKRYEAFTILGISDNRRGHSPHWKVVGA